MTTIDQAVLTQALALANAFAFGFMQVMLVGLPSKWKPIIFTALSTFATAVVYSALLSDNIYVQLIVAGVTGATGVTGAVNFYKNDIKPEVPVKVEPSDAGV